MQRPDLRAALAIAGAAHLAVLLLWQVPRAEPNTQLGPLQTRWLPPQGAANPALSPATLEPTQAAAPEGPQQAPIGPQKPNFDEKPELAGVPSQFVATKTVVFESTTVASGTAAAALQPPASSLALEGAGQTGGAANPPSAAWALPGSVRLRYELRTSDNEAYAGTAELIWRHDGTQYEARLRAGNVLRDRLQTSSGRIDASGLSPNRFVDRNRTEVATHFELDMRDAGAPGGQVVFSNNRPNAALVPGTQDRLSVWIQLSALLAAQPQRVAVDQTWRVPTAGSTSLDDWVFRVVAFERLALPAGELEAWHVVRELRHERDQRLELWLAPSVQWLPVRVRITQNNGTSLEQVLTGTAPP
jgi:hypothetical protein